MVNRELVPRRQLEPGRAVRISRTRAANLWAWPTVLPFLAPGKVPLYLEDGAAAEIDTAALDGDTLGLEIDAGGRRVVYLANCASLTDAGAASASPEPTSCSWTAPSGATTR